MVRLRSMTMAVLVLLSGFTAQAARRVLYVTATAGFRHVDSITASIQVMQDLARESGGVLEVVHTEDLSLITAEQLRNFDVVYFFTSGELPLSDRQKSDLLEFVRQGKGFGGSHSATDTLYTWPEYGDLIGAYFDGHPWAQEGAIDVEDPENPMVRHMAPSFRATEEFYQFPVFSRDRVRVLLTLDLRSVDRNAPGVKRTDGDFPLVWIRKYGQGRVFYSAFGHFVESFQLPVFRTMLKNALLWLAGEIEADATPRSGLEAAAPVLPAGGVHNPGGADEAFAPGAIVELRGERLTSGSSLSAGTLPLPVRLAGTHVEVNGIEAPLFSVAPDRVVAQLPEGLTPGAAASVTLSSVNRSAAPAPVRMEAAAPGLLAAVRSGGVLVLYCTGLGATNPAVAAGAASPVAPPAYTRVVPSVTINDRPAVVQFSGLAPGLAGLYQVNALIPAGLEGALEIVVEAGGRTSNRLKL